MLCRSAHSTGGAEATQEVEQLDIPEEQHEETCVSREEVTKYTGEHNCCRNLFNSLWRIWKGTLDIMFWC